MTAFRGFCEGERRGPEHLGAVVPVSASGRSRPGLGFRTLLLGRNAPLFEAERHGSVALLRTLVRVLIPSDVAATVAGPAGVVCVLHFDDLQFELARANAPLKRLDELKNY